MILKRIYKCLKIITINFTLLYFFLYLIEIGINYKNKRLFKKTRLYYLNDLKNKTHDNNIYLNIGPYKLIDKDHKLLPLSGYKNSTIVLCLDEFNKPVYYFSDENGFNNNIINKKNDLLLIGDSYVQGMCVKIKDNFNSQFLKFELKTTSLGVGGNGPLLELATYKEFENEHNYKDVILFITPSNDFKDL